MCLNRQTQNEKLRTNCFAMTTTKKKKERNTHTHTHT